MSTIGASCCSKMDTEHEEAPERLKRWDAQIEHHWHADYVKHGSASRYWTEVKYDQQRALLKKRLNGRSNRVGDETPWAQRWD